MADRSSPPGPHPPVPPPYVDIDVWGGGPPSGSRGVPCQGRGRWEAMQPHGVHIVRCTTRKVHATRCFPSDVQETARQRRHGCLPTCTSRRTRSGRCKWDRKLPVRQEKDEERPCAHARGGRNKYRCHGERACSLSRTRRRTRVGSTGRSSMDAALCGGKSRRKAARPQHEGAVLPRDETHTFRRNGWRTAAFLGRGLVHPTMSTISSRIAHVRSCAVRRHPPPLPEPSQLQVEGGVLRRCFLFRSIPSSTTHLFCISRSSFERGTVSILVLGPIHVFLPRPSGCGRPWERTARTVPATHRPYARHRTPSTWAALLPGWKGSDGGISFLLHRKGRRVGRCWQDTANPPETNPERWGWIFVEIRWIRPTKRG